MLIVGFTIEIILIFFIPNIQFKYDSTIYKININQNTNVIKLPIVHCFPQYMGLLELL